MPALQISNLTDFQAWATCSSSTTAHYWRSTCTPLVTISATESEVLALTADTQEAVYLCMFANELGLTETSSTTLYEDCTAAVALSLENSFRNRSKHIAFFHPVFQHPTSCTPHLRCRHHMHPEFEVPAPHAPVFEVPVHLAPRL